MLNSNIDYLVLGNRTINSKIINRSIKYKIVNDRSKKIILNEKKALRMLTKKSNKIDKKNILDNKKKLLTGVQLISLMRIY